VVESLVAAETHKVKSPLARLSERELETLSELAQGKSNVAIANELGVSERAVEKHVGSIFTKLDIFDSRDSNRRVKAVLVFLSHRP
jgi:DNA-binding NarL/FixJ family response regulator